MYRFLRETYSPLIARPPITSLRPALSSKSPIRPETARIADNRRRLVHALYKEET